MASCEQRIERHPRTFAPSHHRTLNCGQILNVIAPPFTRISRRAGLGVAVSILFAVAVAPGPSPAAAQPRGQTAAFPCDVQTTERIVAVGDVHGAFDQFVAILRTAGLIDIRDRWSGKTAVLVQTGDMLDRGHDPGRRSTCGASSSARPAGRRPGHRAHRQPRVHAAGRRLALRQPGETDAFANADSDDLRERAFVVFTRSREGGQPPGSPSTPRPTRAVHPRDSARRWRCGSRSPPRASTATGCAARGGGKVNGIVFLHGGISDAVASMGCEAINGAVART